MAIWVILNHSLIGQNKLLNGGFDEITTCPTTVNQLEKAAPWFSPNLGTPELFNICGTPPLVGVPNNMHGYEFPKNGDGYAMIALEYFNGRKFYEYIAAPISGMEEREYILEFSISLCEMSRYYTNELSVYFSEIIPTKEVDNYIQLSPQINISEDWLNVSDGWQTVRLNFIGNDSFNYIVIGFFNDLFNMDKMNFNLNGYGIVYYIDAVSITAVDYYKSIPDTTLCRDSRLVLEAPYYPDMSYRWYYEGQWLSDSSTLYHEPAQEGWYVLHYTDFRGDSYTDSVYVTVQNCPELWLPTWFNPAQNQYWRPLTSDIESMELTIYNTLGQVIQRYTGHPGNYTGWDGFSIAQGMYYATVNARAYNGEQLKAVEKVMVVRQ